MEIAAVTILYNPDELWIHNVMTYIHLIDKLILLDNSTVVKTSIPEIISKKSIYIHENENQGISKRLNQAMKIAKMGGSKYLLTMDQDSSFKTDQISSYLSMAHNEFKKENIIAVGLQGFYPSNPASSGKDLLITSGTIVNIEKADRIHGFDENLFIDYVDTEFCLRAWKHGYATVSMKGIEMMHTIGKEILTWTPNFKKELRKFHQPKRLYYLMRNFLYTRKRYPEYKIYVPLGNIIYEFKNSFLYSGKPISCVYNTLKGIEHYFRNKMGK